MSLEDIRKKSLKDYQRLSNTLCVPFKMYVNKVKNCLTHIHKREKVKKKIKYKGLPQPLQWPTHACLNWLVQTGCYTVWRDKSRKATVTLFKLRLLD